MAPSKYKDEIVFKVYELAASGLSDGSIARALGIALATYNTWKKKRKLFRLAITSGRKSHLNPDGSVLTVADYVYKRLPKKVRRTWDRICAADKAKAGVEKIERILEKKGKTMRQRLLLHAITVSNFSISSALRKVNISFNQFNQWKEKDSDFAELVEEVEWHRKNFFEDHLAKLVAGGDSSATIFVNKTLNRDRGYNEKLDINLKGSVDVNTLDIDKLDLSLEVRKALLEAIRKRDDTNGASK